MGNMLGSVIRSKGIRNNLDFINASKEAARTHEWIYQCTSFAAFKNIIESQQIWLSNLRDVNDKEEVGRISVPKYEDLFYVACFTYMDNIDDKHWEEYGYGEEGILYSFKQNWIKKEPVFLEPDKQRNEDIYFKIYQTSKEALEATVYELKNNKRLGCNPYYIMDFDFYQIVYDDKLKLDMQGICDWEVGDIGLSGKYITPGLPGIIKSEKGLCTRPGKKSYIKDWTEEKEIRLKVCVQSYGSILPKGMYIPKMAVPLNDGAFSKLRVRFSPKMSENKKEAYIHEIYDLLPNSEICILD